MKISRKILIFLVLTFTCVPTFSMITASESKVATQVSKDFIQVAKKAIPAVVSIQVRAKEIDQSEPNLNQMQDPFSDFFQDDFFQHFFKPRFERRYQQTPSPQVGQASGFIVSADGYILTNNHVVKDAGQINVVLNDGKEFSAKVIGQDPNTDVAVIKIDAQDLPHLNLGNSDQIEVGQWVVAIGNPLGLQASLTVGVVSAKGRNNLDIARIEDFIQTDAAINRGNSGGPLLDLNGEVVGINTAIVSNMGSGGYMGIGFAIPSNMANHVMQELIDNGSVTRGFLGVVLQSIDQDLANAFELNKVEGALIAEVQKDSPASHAGVEQGDIVIQYNDHPVTNIASLRNAVALMKPGTKITLIVLRDGKTLTLPITIGNFPKGGLRNEESYNKLGFEVENLSTDIARNLGYVDETGVVVSKVKPGSAAAWAGIKKGALILSVNKINISSIEEFEEALEKTSEGKPVLMLIKQGDTIRYVSMKTG